MDVEASAEIDAKRPGRTLLKGQQDADPNSHFYVSVRRTPLPWQPTRAA